MFDFVAHIETELSVTIDYWKSLEQMVAEGKYDWVSTCIEPKFFPLTGRGVYEVELALVHYGCGRSSDAVLADLAVRGLKPAKIEHLLAFGAKYPDKQREFKIIALGSVWGGINCWHNFVYLSWCGSRHHLDWDWYDSGWSGVCSFLAVRKSTLSSEA